MMRTCGSVGSLLGCVATAPDRRLHDNVAGRGRGDEGPTRARASRQLALPQPATGVSEGKQACMYAPSGPSEAFAPRHWWMQHTLGCCSSAAPCCVRPAWVSWCLRPARPNSCARRPVFEKAGGPVGGGRGGSCHGQGRLANRADGFRARSDGAVVSALRPPTPPPPANLEPSISSSRPCRVCALEPRLFGGLPRDVLSECPPFVFGSTFLANVGVLGREPMPRVGSGLRASTPARNSEPKQRRIVRARIGWGTAARDALARALLRIRDAGARGPPAWVGGHAERVRVVGIVAGGAPRTPASRLRRDVSGCVCVCLRVVGPLRR